MKQLIVLTLLSISVGCSSKESALKQTDTAPSIGLLSDTLFIREKDPLNLNGNGVLQIQALPVGPQQMHLRLHDSSGHVQFRYRGQVLSNDQPVVVTGEWNSLYCQTDTAGVFGIEIALMDQLGRIGRRLLVVRSAAAQRPRASLLWRADERDQPQKRYYFDASGCAQPYGKVMSYHYVIGGQAVVSNTEKLVYNFHRSGSYPVSFFVVDDLGQHSDTLHQIIDVL